ncbi:MAG: LysR substrate-binding domain-containing protein [Thioalkalivibrionaceae bacterium]
MRRADLPLHLVRHATLRQLQVFEAIVRLGSFTQAAHELHLTQPTVSIQIRKLTEAVGLPLFEQVGRRVFPTEVGRELYQTVRLMLGALTDLEVKLAELQGLRRGRLRLSVITTAQYFAPGILGEFSRRYPDIDLALEVNNLDQVLTRIAANEDDLYIIGSVPDGHAHELEVFPFAPNPLVVIAGRDHPLVGKPRLSIQTLGEVPLLLREPGSGIRETTLRLLREHGVTPKIRMELGSNEAIKQAVIGGLGLAVASLHTLHNEGVSGPLRVLDVEAFPVMKQWHIVHPRRKRLSLVARRFLDFAIADEARVASRVEALLREALPTELAGR